MKIHGWKYYNHAAIPTSGPHEIVNLEPIIKKTIWKMEGKPLFARWTEIFDIGYETEWCYCIKDEPFDFNQVKSKIRSEIRKGLKLNEVKIVKAYDYSDDIYRLSSDCYVDYLEQYRPEHSLEITTNNCIHWDFTHFVYLAFSKETGEATGFACVEPINDYINYEILKVPNRYKNKQTVAALTYNILVDHLNTGKFKYVCDGARNLVHQTNFMDYLVKQLDIRYAYCNLRMSYRPIINPLIYVLYPFRELFKKWSNNKLMYNISAVLKIEQIARNNGRLN